MAVCALAFARARSRFAPGPVIKVAGGRRLTTTITVSPSAVDTYNLEPHIAETLKAMFPEKAASALTLAHKLEQERAERRVKEAERLAKEAERLAKEAERAKEAEWLAKEARKAERQAMEAERRAERRAKVAEKEKAGLIESTTKVLARAEQAETAAKEQMLRATTTFRARYIQEMLERKLGVVGRSRLDDWKRVLARKENHDLLQDIHVHCLRRPKSQFGENWPTNKDIRDAAQKIDDSYGVLSSGTHHPGQDVLKNSKGHIEIDTTNANMCIVYQLGRKLHQHYPDITVVEAAPPE